MRVKFKRLPVSRSHHRPSECPRQGVWFVAPVKLEVRSPWEEGAQVASGHRHQFHARILQGLTKCSRTRRVTASLAFESASRASIRFYATTANRDLVNLLNGCVSPVFYPLAIPIAFTLTFRLVVLLVPVDKCGERERLRHEKSVQDSIVWDGGRLRTRRFSMVMSTRACVLFFPSYRLRGR